MTEDFNCFPLGITSILCFPFQRKASFTIMASAQEWDKIHSTFWSSRSYYDIQDYILQCFQYIELQFSLWLVLSLQILKSDFLDRKKPGMYRGKWNMVFLQNDESFLECSWKLIWTGRYTGSREWEVLTSQKMCIWSSKN